MCLQKLLVCLLLLLVADTIVGGPIGLLFRGERHLILALMVLVAGYVGISRWQEERISRTSMRKNMLWPLGFFLISLAWIVPVPMLIAGDVSMALRDAQGLILLPVTTLLLYAIKDIADAARRLFTAIVVFATCLSIFQLAVWFWLECNPTSTDVYYPILKSIFNTTRSIFVGWHSTRDGGYVRVVWISSIWLVVAVFVAPLVVGRRWLFFVEFVLGMAIYVSYTRGIWLGVIAGLLFCTVANYMGRFRGKSKSTRIKNWHIVILALMLSTITISTIDYVARGQFGFLSRVADFSSSEGGGGTDESNNERKMQADLLIKMWSERPWMGWGYGAYVPDHFSDEQAPYSYEMLPFALLMKLGVIGFTMYLMFWAGLILYALKKTRSEHGVLFAGGFSAFLLASHTNPFLFNFVGMSVVMFFLLWWASLNDECKNE